MENEQETELEVQEQGQEPENPARDNEALDREIESGKAAIAELKQALAVKESEITVLNQSLEEAKKRLDEAGKSLATAAGAYRELVVQTNPGVLAEMINGDSIEKINESLQSARAIMERARREVEAEAARVRVPAGAPQRAPMDLSALTAREKIQYGLETK
jgi:chromosome segregation ATPase